MHDVNFWGGGGCFATNRNEEVAVLSTRLVFESLACKETRPGWALGQESSSTCQRHPINRKRRYT